ncbi:leucine-rich repeat protein, partial [bacterium]|nr:leucine-rich repeat protein [bacterium]
TSIGTYAFFGASALTSITVNSNNTHYKDIDGVLFNKDGTTLIQYPIGNTRTTYTIPEVVWIIGERAFFAASALTSFTVNSNNTHYKAINGVLFNKDGTTLVKYPDSNTRTTYTIPDGVTTIDIYSFREAPNLTSIAIPASVSPISYSYWLYGSLGLTTIYASQDLIDTMGWTRSDSTDPPTLNTISGISGITVSTDQPPAASPAPICFPAGTPVTTDQGLVAIEKLNTDKHTIRGKEIVAITQTRPLQKHIVCFEKDSLSKNVPSQETRCSMQHKVFYKREMMKARDIVKLCENVSLVPYNGETLYNVLLKKQGMMVINNLICETLDPKNIMAKISTMKDGQKKNKAICQLTKIIKENNVPEYQKLYASL